MPKTKRFTIYDAMNEAGVFEANPANPDSRGSENQSLYTGPVEYPKMFYHPEGAMQVIVPGNYEQTLLGPAMRDQLSELIFAFAHSKEDEAKLRADGWHDHPAKAHAKREGKEMPVSKEETIAAQEQRIKELQAQLADSKAAELAKASQKPQSAGK